jgi:hypothetical protein
MLSKHVYIAANNSIENQSFEVEGQIGDNIDYKTKEGDINIIIEDIDYIPDPNETLPPPEDDDTTDIEENDTLTSTQASSATQDQTQAIIRAQEATYRNGQTRGKCSTGVRNIVHNYVNAMKGKDLFVPVLADSTKNLPPGSTRGNANDASFWKNMTRLGYSQQIIGSNMSKQEVMNHINTTSFSIGDVLVYWANDNPNDKGASQYGHTQVYVGNSGNDGKQWTTDNKGNYNGSQFVYRKSGYSSWNLIVFKSPTI